MERKKQIIYKILKYNRNNYKKIFIDICKLSDIFYFDEMDLRDIPDETIRDLLINYNVDNLRLLLEKLGLDRKNIRF